MFRIPCGGFYLDEAIFKLIKVGEKNVITLNGDHADDPDVGVVVSQTMNPIPFVNLLDLKNFRSGDPFSEPFTSNELYNYSTARVINIAIEITDTDGVDRYCYPVLNRYIVADTQLYGWAGVDGETGVKIDLRKVTSDSDEYEIVCTFPETV